MSTSAAFAAQPPVVKGLSQVERVVDTFIAPGKTFRDILRDASWWLPMLLLVFSTLAQAYIIDHQVGFERIVQTTLDASPAAQDRMSQLTPEQRAQQIKGSVTGQRIGTYAAGVLLLVFFAIYSLMVWGLFNFALGAATKFPQVLAVTIYAALPFLLNTVLMAITLYFGGNPEAFNPRNPVGTNPAYYMPGMAPWLAALVGRLDVIQLWSLVLNCPGHVDHQQEADGSVGDDCGRAMAGAGSSLRRSCRGVSLEPRLLNLLARRGANGAANIHLWPRRKVGGYP